MAKKLLININMFRVNQDVYEIDGDHANYLASLPLDEVSRAVYAFGNGDIEEVEVDGNTDFIQKIGYEIIDELNKYYSDRNVRVKLNGEIFNQ